jgi:hypothetical protein
MPRAANSSVKEHSVLAQIKRVENFIEQYGLM